MTWSELTNIDMGEAVLALLRAALIVTAQKRESGSLTRGKSCAPDGYAARVAANIEDLSQEAYLAAVRILARMEDNTDADAEVVAYHAANAVLCREYRKEKKNPGALTVSRDDEDVQSILDGCAVIGEYYDPASAITAADLIEIAERGAHSREDVNRRKKAVAVMLEGMSEKEAAREGGLTHGARKRLASQITAYCLG